MASMTRRSFSALAAGALWPLAGLGQGKEAALVTRAIPSSGERIPAVGLGTAIVFNNDDPKIRETATQILRTLLDKGGTLVDTASTYGDAELVLGQAMPAAASRDKFFVATKLESPDPAELERSLTRLATRRVDLLQLHNVRNPGQSLAQFKTWKTQGVCRYVGITSTSERAYDAVASVLRREKPDFVQIDYSLDNREVEDRILPLAAEVRAGVLTALPFGRGRLFRAVRGKSLPDWSTDFAESWAQFFLKYLLGDERVTAVIPGTSDPGHMADNLGAMRGRLPDAAERKRMVAFVQTL
ncbi:aldo/keto reductase [Variovorax sp. Sphag1AA]|uniref:aldo/keto reductase n=1 Tax=Variovorax sp. Sphag1AA TaxID=2587027 RepID=UPI00161ACE49|nr:aldo/keto reductase [Variovorax sp. Sphag1AA]MBB3176722.1 aryl-alcohol dehydrogenase-like predicted oxidoreductase [Variovorax sp. Sphag1AA]